MAPGTQPSGTLFYQNIFQINEIEAVVVGPYYVNRAKKISGKSKERETQKLKDLFSRRWLVWAKMLSNEKPLSNSSSTSSSSASFEIRNWLRIWSGRCRRQTGPGVRWWPPRTGQRQSARSYSSEPDWSGQGRQNRPNAIEFSESGWKSFATIVCCIF